MSMLKSLKNKKDGKADPKKDSKKEKESKKDTKKQVKEEEEETNEALVDINYDQKQATPTTKKINKIQSNKLEEKEIDTSNIIVEKKEEKKVLSTWIVQQSDIDTKFREKFDMNKVDTDFESLTDQKFNKELAEKRQKETEQKKTQVEEIAGFRFAPLEVQNQTVTTKANPNQPVLAIRSPSDNFGANINLTPQVQSLTVNPPQFSNSKQGSFAPLEKTAQQLKEEELQKKLEVKPKAASNWLGTGKKNEDVPQPQEFKVSAWAQKAENLNSAPVKFAQLQKSTIEKRSERVPEQQFVFVSRKDQEQRRRKREEADKAKV